MASETARLRFGVIADSQFADADDGKSYAGDEIRYYRHAEVALRRAAAAWGSTGSSVSEEARLCKGDLGFVAHLGDIVDGREKTNRSDAVRAAGAALADVGCDAVFVHGNHEFYTRERDYEGQTVREWVGRRLASGFAERLDQLHLPRCVAADGDTFAVDDQLFTMFEAAPGIRVIVLDPYDISLIGREEGTEKQQQAVALLSAHNPNSDDDVNSPEGLEGLARRWVGFNGAVGETQLAWLRDTLEACEADGAMALVFSHVPLSADAVNDPISLAWNYAEVLEVLEASSAVAACFYGHDHRGGYACTTRPDGSLLHHVILEAILTCPSGHDAYGVVSVLSDCLVVQGFGMMRSHRLPFRATSPSPE